MVTDLKSVTTNFFDEASKLLASLTRNQYHLMIIKLEYDGP